MQESVETLRIRLNRETAKIAWPELQPHFARGMVVKVAPELDLVEVAVGVIRDDKQRVEEWMAAGKIARASVGDARAWMEKKQILWAVVTAPWVLVQENANR